MTVKGDPMELKVKIIITLIYFLILYIVALVSNWGYWEKDDILFVSRRQWKALLIMWLPALVLFKD